MFKNPLLCAYHGGNVECFKFLLEKGAKPNNVSIHRNLRSTIFTHAAANYNLKVLQLMLEYGVDVNESDRGSNETAFICLMESEKPGDWKTVADFLIKHGANIHCKNYKGSVYFSTVFSYDECEKFKYLYEKGIDINLENSYGETVLFSCFEIDYIKFLFELGINLNHKDRNGNSYLMNFLNYFRRCRDTLTHFDAIIEMFDFAIEHRVDINHVNDDGETVLSIARTSFDEDSPLIQFLLSKGAR